MIFLRYTALLIIPICLFFGVPKKTFGQIAADSSLSEEKISPEKINLIIDKNLHEISPEEIKRLTKENSKLTINQSYHSEIEFPDFCLYQKSLICRLTLSNLNYSRTKKTYEYEIDALGVENLVKDLAKKFNRDPENAKLKMENGRVATFAISSPGVILDEIGSAQKIITYLKNGDFSSPKIELPFEKIEPEISTDSIENLGVTSLIGQGKSNFKGSPKNRIYNINVATEKFNGLLIKPGEEFSFVKNLGEVDGEHGYLPELVIKNDKTEPEFGGGICQVSTTAFRAAINSGLEITARKNHAYPVSYYNPQGMDATIYVPRPDLRFKNDTPGHILIETKIEGTELTFNFYGTLDGRKINVIGPTILERGADGSMKTTFTQQIFDANENLVREDIFKSFYDSPNKYPHPGEETTLTKKPKDWSKKQWETYKKIH